jgi:serine/alanine adding enzyme
MVSATLAEPGGSLHASASAIVVDEAPGPSDWEKYVSGQAGATSYHRWPWRSVFRNAFGRESTYLIARDGERTIGVLPLVEFRNRLFGTFAVSLPFVNYGGVVADDERAARALASHAVALARQRGWAHVELRHTTRRYPEWPARRHKVAMCLPLPHDPDTLWTSLDRKVRNQVRKAEKCHCVAEDGGRELLSDFYRVFARNMRDLGTPVYGKRFFDEVVRAFPDDTRVFIVRVGAEPIAASLTISWRDRVEVPWASALRDHSDKSPNMLLYWAMLRWATKRGVKTFDFGRSTPDEGTFQFKRQWGAEPSAFAWEYLGLAGQPPDLTPANPRFRAAISVWQRLPLRLATALGPAIIRHIP